ncbi:ABC transporter permease [Hespellia stercorisuis]|uniref:ABC-2 family transporter protein n=1 Tax=Hespellia stercorisuis DSM 15480 TaxID=1121950 RepID=A0A1M6N0A3_9FIRM|nr:ABC transporter permease subunit [Hespellia stercorisuis]SHJ89169.1 ABC-2 family transporter protein [Hespellia stercorisuis DSM 15480]
MKKLVYFEWKRIWMGKLIKLSLIGCCVFIVFCFYSSIAQISATDLNGAVHSGLQGAAVLKETRPEQVLDERRVKEIISEYLDYTAHPETSSDQEKFQYLTEEMYLKYYVPNRDLLTLISSVYTPLGENYSLKESFEAGMNTDFYSARKERVKEWLQMKERRGLLKGIEKEYWLEEDAGVPTYVYGYYKGWEDILNSSSWLILIMIVICIGTAPVFAGEYQTKSDSLLLSLKYGKNKLIKAKLTASLLYATLVYCGIVLSYSLAYLLILGAEGGDLPLQLINTYPISYNLTIKQAVILFLLLMYAAVLLMVCVTLFMSSVFKSSYTVIIVDFLLIVIPSFLYFSMGGYLWQHILALFPSKITEFKYDDYITYSMGGFVLEHLTTLIISYAVLCVLFMGAAYQKFRMHEVNR